MAKLGVYYGLCPLIDHRSLLGVYQDEEAGVVIVTLGKNIAIKYKLSDQKQLHSWRTKEKFSSPIIFDKQESQYVAVFNQTYIRRWKGNEEQLDKLKKFKFNQQIHTIFTCNDMSFIVFKNGDVFPLNKAIDNRKELQPTDVIDPESETIQQVLYTHHNDVVYVGLMVEGAEQNYLHWTRFGSLDEKKEFNKIVINRINFKLTGYIFHVTNNLVNFLSLWSDGRMYSVALQTADLDLSDPGELIAVVESLSCKENVSMFSLDENYIAMYGCHSDEEGALLIIYNVQFKVTQSKQPFKLFTREAKMWNIEDNLFLPVGQNLAVVPFCLDTEQLAALVGSHKLTDSDPDIAIVHHLEVADWNTGNKPKEELVPEKIKSNVLELASQGLPENVILSDVVSECIEKKNFIALAECVDYFCDIPEKCLSNILKFVLNVDAKAFTGKKLSGNVAHKLIPLERANLVDLILTKPFSEILLLPHLRSDLNIDNVVTILEYFTFLLSENGHSLPTCNFVESERKIIEWTNVIIDANYQKIILTRDNKITEVLQLFSGIVKFDLESLDELQEVAPLITQLKKGNNPITNLAYRANMDYTVEKFPG